MELLGPNGGCGCINTSVAGAYVAASFLEGLLARIFASARDLPASAYAAQLAQEYGPHLQAH